MTPVVFLLSPASVGGRRAELLLRAEAAFPLARRLRAEGAPLGEVFSFLSGLYFRGKLRYATTFQRPPAGVPGALVITTCRGLLPPDSPVTPALLRTFAAVPIEPGEARYRDPLVADARRLAADAADARVVLLGSVASGKYVDLLLDVFGARLCFPAAFVGRGDMSRGGLLLRAAEDRTELDYVPVAGAVRRGARPPRLTPRPGLLRAAEERAGEDAGAETEGRSDDGSG